MWHYYSTFNATFEESILSSLHFHQTVLIENIREQKKDKNWSLGRVVRNFRLAFTLHLRMDVLTENLTVILCQPLS